MRGRENDVRLPSSFHDSFIHIHILSRPLNFDSALGIFWCSDHQFGHIYFVEDPFPMATQATPSALPRLVAKPLAKISHATGPRDSTTLKWMHLKERDDLVVALDHVRVVTRGGQYVDRRVIRVVCGAEMVVSVVALEHEMRSEPMLMILGHPGSG